MLRLDWNLLFTVINLLILYVLMKRFLFKPVNEILEKRQREEDARLSAAEEAKNSALKSKEEYEASIKNAEQEKKKIMQQAETAVRDMVVTAAARVAGEKEGTDNDRALYDEFLRQQ